MSTEISASNPLVFYVNNVKIVEPEPNPEEMLIGYLRRKCHVTGTKLACGEGGCGACTVTVSRYSPSEQSVSHIAVNACLAPVCTMHAAAVTTIEGLGSSRQPHQLQQQLAQCHATQCGFCSPGILMSASSLMRSHGNRPSDADIEEAVMGNLCRCTGYRPIVTALCAFSTDNKDGTRELIDYDSSMDPEFPPELKTQTSSLASESLQFTSSSATWFRPSSLQSLLQLKQRFPMAKLICGNTEIGVEQNCQSKSYSKLIHAAAVQELQQLLADSSGLTIGAAVTLTQLQLHLKSLLADEEISDNRRRTILPFVECLRWFSSVQIRNVAAIGGNVMTASPISDLNPLLLSCGAELVFCSVQGERRQKVTDEFFCGYRRVRAEQHEVLVRIHIPWCRDRELLTWAKQSRRRDDDIAIVNCSLRLRLSAPDASGRCDVADARLCFGGMSATTQTASRATAALIGRRWQPASLLATARNELLEDFQLRSSSPGGQAAYRLALAASLLLRFFSEVDAELLGREPSDGCIDASATRRLQRAACASGVQVADEAKQQQPLNDFVGRSHRVVGGLVQATGEAKFIDDIPRSDEELFLAPIIAGRATGRISRVDFSQAELLDGVVGFITADDLPGDNAFGSVVKDDFVFAKDNEASFCGDVVAAVVGKTREAAMRAAKLATPIFCDEAEGVEKPIVTISDAVAAGSFFAEAERHLRHGDAQAEMQRAAVTVRGIFRVGGQNHFYMEPQSCIVIPKDGGTELSIRISSQNLSFVQETVASATSLAAHRIAVGVKRLGGGFGGKETRCAGIAALSAVAAIKFNRTVRCVLDRGTDMTLIGTRHPMRAEWRAGADSSGRILALQVDAFLNGGCSSDMSAAVAECVIMKAFNAYRVPAADFRVRVCRTNTPSNTAFRGFGAPQAMALMETVMSELAAAAAISDTKIREINFIQEGDVSPFGQKYTDVTVAECWAECLKISKFERRSQEISEFNRGSKWKKRAVFMSPVHYGIGFGHHFLHQSGAIVHVYLDGTALITHGGVDMGQGLHTKMIQVASRELQLHPSKIFISESSTDKVPNTTSSAASMTTDLNAPAVQDACRQIRRRLAPVAAENPEANWEELIRFAYFRGISLSANGFFHDPNPHLDSASMRGQPFIYFTSGAACSEVEIDVISGDHVLRRSDLVIDLGRSLNPAVDIGQVEGAFVQGCGLYTLEELRYSPEGQLRSKGPGAYKIPSFGDIPEQLNVTLLRGSECRYERAVHSSKAVGEPPLCLAVSVFMSLRAAVVEARRQFGSSAEQIDFNSPATAEHIRLMCADPVAMQLEAEQRKTSADDKAWEVKLSD